MLINTKFSIEELEKLDTRSVVGYVLEKLHDKNDYIVAVYADVGSRFSVKGKMNESELEIGISEQSLIPILGGMAHEGLVPFGIAYAPFITMRAADQIRMTVGEMGLPIIIVGGSAGLISGNLGAASLALDDIAMMRAIPNVVIFSPSDCVMAARMIQTAAILNKPVYIRLTGGKQTLQDHSSDCNDLFKYRTVLKNGKDAIIYATGASVNEACEAASSLSKKGLDVTVVDVTTIKPIDADTLKKYSTIKKVFTVEEHSIIGGMGSAIAEYISENFEQKVVRLGVKDTYLYPDTYENLLAAAEIDAVGIERQILSNIK